MTLDRAPTGSGSLRKARREMYRQQIMAASEMRFAEVGFANTKMSDIARAAEVSLATVYASFDGKDEIWDELNSVRMTELVESATSAIDGLDSPVEQFVAAAVAVATFFAEHPGFLDLHINEGFSWATAHAAGVGRGNQQAAWEMGFEALADLASMVSPDSAAGGARVLAGLTIASVQVHLTEWVRSGRDQPAAEVAAEVGAHVRRLLEGRSAASDREARA
ncbi:TetR/AcrR family transcriptional regulator [Dietzia sp. SYD-A1]|uniref:TetR/AcrR family transcriptional regulator n=1 Tax=Dietzia sp. SYD-A1 TaxID=2780141 RepID=UPI00189133B6|nr:TetR/AcrR family transcriptional regulator [Dietzia sp. SYD-A1]